MASESYEASKQGSCESCEAAFKLEFVGSFSDDEVTADPVDVSAAFGASHRLSLLSSFFDEELVSVERILQRAHCWVYPSDLSARAIM